ncbi:hypothetical protein EJV47_22795 [Hymenobacter gummosus]|uniref:Lipoprotein n=1 Tax=Hymenobacter gummosus TaxID=1776032 RepID=A0A3S0H649_9BACT|nr:hypothetical protein [Hymenobacter gummosus]RTQ45990.1 hypothetical protein EJV47_22795 [Hymenobacter gummosus]
MKTMPALYSCWPLVLLVALGSSCQRPAAAGRYLPPAPTPAPAARPQMVFMSFKATAQPAGAAAIELLQSTVVAGAPKPAAAAVRAGEPAYLRIAQLDARRQVVAAVVVAHPLRRAVETSTPEGALQRQAVTLPEAEFFVRLALLPQAAGVRVEEFIDQQSIGTTDFPVPAHD